MKKVQEVLIGSTFTAMGAGDVNTTALAAGTMVAYDQDRDGVISTADRYFNIARADVDFQSIQSMDIQIGQIKRVTKRAYAAAVNQVTTLTIDPGDVANNRYYYISIAQANNPDYTQTFQQPVSIVSGGAATATTIAAQFAAAINANTSLPCTATSALGVITITCKTPYDVITVIKGDGLSVASVVAITVAPDPGSGTNELVRALEDACIAYKGNMNRVEFPVPYRSYVNAAAGYVTYCIEHGRRTDTENVNDEVLVNTIVCIDKDAAAGNFTNFEAVIAATGVTLTTITG